MCWNSYLGCIPRSRITLPESRNIFQGSLHIVFLLLLYRLWSIFDLQIEWLYITLLQKVILFDSLLSSVWPMEGLWDCVTLLKWKLTWCLDHILLLFSKNEIRSRAPGWFSRLSIELLILVQVMISWLWNCLCWQYRACLVFCLSLSLCLFLPLPHSLVLSVFLKINKQTKKMRWA